MAAGDDQHHAGVGQRPVLQGVGRDVAGQVVDSVERPTERVGEGLGAGQPDLEGAREAGAGGDGYRVELVGAQPGAVEGLADDGVEGVQVGPGRDLRDDPAETGVLVHAGGDDVGEQPAATHDARPGLVARRLDPEHHRRSRHTATYPYCELFAIRVPARARPPRPAARPPSVPPRQPRTRQKGCPAGSA